MFFMYADRVGGRRACVRGGLEWFPWLSHVNILLEREIAAWASFIGVRCYQWREELGVVLLYGLVRTTNTLRGI